MTLYAVGDLQGCLQPLKQLLDHVKFDPAKDMLWLTGDLVNRGPDSLGCLNFVRELDGAAKTVLGNHDLHLLAIYALGLKAKDNNLQKVIEHPHAETLLHWLAQQPLLVRDEERRLIMTHAGIPPVWSDKQARQLATEVQTILVDADQRRTFFEAMYGNKPNVWTDSLQGFERLRYIVNAFTRMRFCSEKAKLDFNVTDGPDYSPKNMKPWYAWPVKRKHRLVFGHWASLMGQTNNPNYIGLDTGYVWGNYLTLMDLDQGVRYCCDTAGKVTAL
ncbi:MAG: symmetrical bis(5'-nucleosyl)-tetraphosphatase [Reinekea sp.]|jgi:bis(5'-nucleosyl)-tetraphosphatase (symmetrical)